MSHVVTASAPGKLVLAGDYAVLEGAPAIAAAVDLRATVKIELMNGTTHQLRVENTGQTFAFDGGFGAPLHWRSEPHASGTMLAAALNAYREAGYGDAALPPLEISICTRDFYAAGRKKGVGSSAAVAVALTGALAVLTRSPTDMNMALKIHRDFQQSVGSGIDVVSSWSGGVVSMQPGSQPLVEQPGWPADLVARPVWTGRPASTPAMLASLDEFKQSDPAAYKRCFESLCASANKVAAVWPADSVGAILGELQNYADALRVLDELSGIGIWSEPHRELCGLAEQASVIYKPSGAGGGDYGLAFAAEAAGLDAFMESALEQGYSDDYPGWTNSGLTTQPLNR